MTNLTVFDFHGNQHPLIQLTALQKISTFLSIGCRYLRDAENNYAEYDGTWTAQLNRIRSFSSYELAIKILKISVVWMGFLV